MQEVSEEEQKSEMKGVEAEGKRSKRSSKKE